jgi:hypothetical protein
MQGIDFYILLLAILFINFLRYRQDIVFDWIYFADIHTVCIIDNKGTKYLGPCGVSYTTPQGRMSEKLCPVLINPKNAFT